MFAISLIISFLSLGLIVIVHRKNNTTQLMLAASEDEKKELSTTLANILDSDGEIRGQLVLPGHTSTSDAIAELQSAQADMKTLKMGLEEARIELESSQKSEKAMATTLAEIVDFDGTVLSQIRIPGKQKTPPNKTPCGQLCGYALWGNMVDANGNTLHGWRCIADRGQTVESAREHFLDADSQCTMFQAKHEAEIEKMQKKLEVAELKAQIE